MLATPEAPATFSSTVAGVEAADCCPLSARAATIAVVAARLRPAVKARVAGAVGPFFFEGPFGDRPADEPSATAARAAAGIRSVIVVFIFIFVIVLVLVVVVIVVLVLVVIVVNLRLGGRWRTRWQRS
jgi:ABC-type multidrug transport system fused ATPase/permease subunit